MARRTCGLVIALVAAALVSSACASPGPTVAAPGWTPIDPSSLPTQLSPRDVAWQSTLPDGSPFRGAAIKASRDWFALSRVDVDDSAPVASVWVGDARTGALGDDPVEVSEALGQISTFDLGGRPVSLVPVRRDGDAISLFAFDPTTGGELWTLPGTIEGGADSDAYFHIWGATGTAVVGQVSGGDEMERSCAVCALDLATGQLLWSLRGVSPASARAIGTVAVGEKAVVGVLAGVGEAVAVDARTGDVLFRRPGRRPADPQWTSAMVDKDVVVLVESTDDPAALDVVVLGLDGRIAWSAPTTTQPLFDRTTGTLVVTSPAGEVEVRTTRSGSVLWRISAETASRDALALAFARAGRVVANARGTTVAYDSISGELQWASAFAMANAAEWNGDAYITWDEEGDLAAFRGEGEPVGVDLSLGLELPIFIEPRSG